MKNERVTKLLPFIEKEADRLNSKNKVEAEIIKMADLYKAFSLVEQEKCGPSGGLSDEHIGELTHSSNMKLAMMASWVHLIVSLQLIKENQEIFSRQIILPTLSEAAGSQLMEACEERIKNLEIRKEFVETWLVLDNIIA